MLSIYKAYTIFSIIDKKTQKHLFQLLLSFSVSRSFLYHEGNFLLDHRKNRVFSDEAGKVNRRVKNTREGFSETSGIVDRGITLRAPKACDKAGQPQVAFSDEGRECTEGCT